MHVHVYNPFSFSIRYSRNPDLTLNYWLRSRGEETNCDIITAHGSVLGMYSIIRRPTQSENGVISDADVVESFSSNESEKEDWNSFVVDEEEPAECTCDGFYLVPISSVLETDRVYENRAMFAKQPPSYPQTDKRT